MSDTKVIMPQMGESIFEGTITKWLKKAGDRVERDEPLFEISTDKVDSEIPAPASGIVQEILVGEGQTVQINTVVAVIGEGAAKPAAAAAKPAAPAPAVATPPPTPVQTASAGNGDQRDTRSSPLVRRIAREHNVSLSGLSGKGTGINGRVTKRDILSFIEQGAAAPAKPAPQAGRPAPPPPPLPKPAPSQPAAAPVTFKGETHRVQMSQMRKSIAEHMIASRRTSAHVTTFFEVDVTRVLAAQKKLKTSYEQGGIKLTVTPFFMVAAINALKRFPILNASLDGDSIVYKRSINMGIAVNLEWGLIVPVINRADEKNLQGLARALQDLGERARSKKLSPEDVKDGTFTVTNPGAFGGLIGTPIINQPQLAIMGMGGIKKRAVVIDDAIAIRSMIILSLSFDHRVIDGATADMFMADIQKQLETWQV